MDREEPLYRTNVGEIQRRLLLQAYSPLAAVSLIGVKEHILTPTILEKKKGQFIFWRTIWSYRLIVLIFAILALVISTLILVWHLYPEWVRWIADSFISQTQSLISQMLNFIWSLKE